MKRLVLVVSAYNEEAGLPQFYTVAKACCERLLEKGWDHEFFFVDDGSEDGTEGVLAALSASDPGHVRYLSFSRNFGHEAAMAAGLDYARGDALVFMDADLQHPPACLPAIVDKLEEGCDVISMIRTSNKTAGLLKNLSSGGFYWLINRLSDTHFEPNASDFFAISQTVQQVLQKHYREKVRFLRGYVQSVGFQKGSIAYEAAPRTTGHSHYSLRKLFAFSMNTILCFSNMPLKLGIFAGLFSGLLGMVVLLYTLCTRQGAPSGYATIVILNCFMFAMLFIVVGIIGEYIAVLFEEMKDRPVYIVKRKGNIDAL